MGDLPRIVVERYGEDFRILVNGEPLPVPIDDSGVRIMSAPGCTPGVNVTLLAAEVRLVDSLAPKATPEEQQRVTDYLASKAPPSSWRPKPRG